MKKALIISGVVITGLFATLFYLVLGENQNNSEGNIKVAYVRSQELVYNYQGMKDAMSKFDDEKVQWQANVDTLKLDYQRSLKDYQEHYSDYNEIERGEIEALLQHQYENVFKYGESMAKTLDEREAEILEGVLNQINSYSEEWAKANGYDLVLGTTTSGNILYGTQAIDVTEQLIEELNKKYSGV